MDVKSLTVPVTAVAAVVIFVVSAYIQADEIRDDLVLQALAQQATIDKQTENIEKLIEVQEKQTESIENVKLQLLLIRHGIDPDTAVFTGADEEPE